MNLWTRFKIAWRTTRAMEWQETGKWTAEDRNELSVFLNSPGGFKFRMFMQSTSVSLNYLAVQKNDQNVTGRAGGFAFARAWIEELAAPEKVEHEQTSQVIAPDFAQYIP